MQPKTVKRLWIVSILLVFVAGYALGTMREASMSTEESGNEKQKSTLATLTDTLRESKLSQQVLQDERDGLQSRYMQLQNDSSVALEELQHALVKAEENSKTVQAETDVLKNGLGDEVAQPNSTSNSGLTSVEVARRVTKIKTEFQQAFASKDKKAVIALLKEISTLDPRAYDDAIALLGVLAEDWEGENVLGISDMEFYATSGHSKGMMKYALSTPDVHSDMRAGAVYSLAWSFDPEANKLIREQLLIEKDEAVVESMASVLGQRNDPESEAALLAALKNSYEHESTLRSLLLALTNYHSEDVSRAIEDLATYGETESIRQAADIARGLQNPQVNGVAITWIEGNTGLQTGDIIAHYDGVIVKTLRDLTDAMKTSPSDRQVSVTLYRGSRQMTLQIPGGRMQMYGKTVKAK